MIDPLALVLGATLGLGLWTLLGLLPRFGRRRLADRLAPYVVDLSDAARDITSRRGSEPLPVLGAVFGPMALRLQHLLAAALGGAGVIETRLRQADSPLSLDGFRARQLFGGFIGATAGAVVAFTVVRLNGTPFVLGLAIVAIACIIGILAPDWVLQRSAARRVRRMNEELTSLLEFLTLSLSAGEGIVEALRRVANVSAGELAGEIGGVLAEVNAGLPLSATLSRRAKALDMPAFTRCVEQIVGALERGSPLAEVLAAQAQDARDDAKRRLLELAGKKEVTMLFPLVFLILPITILFAIFPGVFVLQVGF